MSRRSGCGGHAPLTASGRSGECGRCPRSGAVAQVQLRFCLVTLRFRPSVACHSEVSTISSLFNTFWKTKHEEGNFSRRPRSISLIRIRITGSQLGSDRGLSAFRLLRTPNARHRNMKCPGPTGTWAPDGQYRVFPVVSAGPNCAISVLTRQGEQVGTRLVDEG